MNLIMRLPRVRVAAGVVAIAAASVAAQQTPPDATDLAGRLQAHYDSVRSFTADFVQTFEGGFLNLPSAERGTLKLRKPGRFRMEYTSPEKKTFVADGVMMYSYFPADKTGSRDRLPQGDQASTALQFLAGQGNLTRDFTARLADEQADGEWRLELTPRRDAAEFRTLLLMVDRRTLALRGFGWTDDQGGTTITRLENLRENVTIPDREFEFTFPPGVIIR